MAQAEGAVIGQQKGTEAGASGDDLGAPFSMPALCEERTYSPPASWWWYGLRPSCALRGRLRRGCPSPAGIYQQTTTADYASDAAASITGGLGAVGHQQAAPGIYRGIAVTISDYKHRLNVVHISGILSSWQTDRRSI